MDTLRGNFSPLDMTDMDIFSDAVDVHEDEEEAVDHTPPPAIGQDERRMQVRAYNFWASLLEKRNFPSVEDLDPTLLPDFGPHSVLLDFTDGIEDPSINFIGALLREECMEVCEELPKRLSEVPARSLLSRITDHYMQILANQSPIGFEAEFVNAVGATILYRGILLPFSSDDETIDFIYGVINWKEMADERSADELLLEIEHALDDEDEDEEAFDEDDIALPEAAPRRAASLTDWADAPTGEDVDDGRTIPARPSFDLSGQAGIEEVSEDAPLPGADEAEDNGANAEAAQTPGLPTAEEALRSVEPSAGDMALADWLAAARDMAMEAKSSEERTRAALYDAVSRAYDFALAAAEAPEDFTELLEDAGLAVQDRAPMTPVVKLVFGTDYDKTRLTEYAAVLSWAQRNDIAQGALGEYLRTAEGGLKAVVAEERAFRRGGDSTKPAPVRTEPRKSIARKLRAMAPQGFNSVAADGGEFGLVMIRRTQSGEVVMLGEVPADAPLIEKAARKLIG